MRTAVLCIVFLVFGAAAGSALTGYFLDRFYKRSLATVFAGDLGRSALQAELIKQGETATVLATLERGLPDYVVAIRGNELLRDSMTAEAAMMATKRFYVCTGTPIPTEISSALEEVTLPTDACPSEP